MYKAVSCDAVGAGCGHRPRRVTRRPRQRPHAINDYGQIVGMAITADEKERAVLWDQGQIIDLGNLTDPGYRTGGVLPASTRSREDFSHFNS